MPGIVAASCTGEVGGGQCSPPILPEAAVGMFVAFNHGAGVEIMDTLASDALDTTTAPVRLARGRAATVPP